MYEDKLKACPFCGGQAHVAYYDADNYKSHIEDALKFNKRFSGEVFSVECENCACSSDFFSEPQEAINIWNNRVS